MPFEYKNDKKSIGILSKIIGDAIPCQEKTGRKTKSYTSESRRKPTGRSRGISLMEESLKYGDV